MEAGVEGEYCGGPKKGIAVVRWGGWGSPLVSELEGNRGGITHLCTIIEKQRGLSYTISKTGGNNGEGERCRGK